jgi:DNA-binding response OmpR family regulator
MVNEMNRKKTKLLLVEDDKNLGFVIKDFLEISGFQVDLKENGVEGYEAFQKNTYELLLLDVMMPLKDGFTLAEEIRKRNNDIPIIFLTAKALTEDKIRGLKIGADDYITKPFSTEELKLRIEAILKRTKFTLLAQPSGNKFEFGQFTFDPSTHILTGPNGERKLTNKESELLYLLVLNKNQVLRREIALKTIWGENDYFMGRSMDVYITKLRKILRPDPSIVINNIHNIGFRLETKSA